MFGDSFQRLQTMGGNGFNQPVFAKFSKLIFRLRNPVTKRDENIAGIQLDRFLRILAVRKQPNHSPAGLQSPNSTICRKDNWRQMTGIGIGEAMLLIVIKAEEKRGIFLWLSALEQMAV